MNNIVDQNILERPDSLGFYGEYGGAFIPELLYPNIKELEDRYESIINESSFRAEYTALLETYVGRPTPLFYAQNLSKKIGAEVWLKREDLCHTGAHKINNTIGQILLAKRLGKKKIIAETGAGQHGVATATVCALMNMPCIVYMGAVDIKRQAPNVARMRMMGAEVRAAESGSKTLKDATNEAMRHWINHPEDTHYIIGSVVGPHPYPDMVAQFQRIISQECITQMEGLPDYVIACVGGGSNAIGAFYEYIKHPSVQLIGVEAAGHGVDTDKTAATLTLGTRGVLHAAMSKVLQTADGQVVEPHSISAGLDYPGIGPAHAYLQDAGRVQYTAVTDQQAVDAAFMLSEIEGIIPALETAHAFAFALQHTFLPSDRMIICLSGRGDKDLQTYMKYMSHDGE